MIRFLSILFSRLTQEKPVAPPQETEFERDIFNHFEVGKKQGHSALMLIEDSGQPGGYHFEAVPKNRSPYFDIDYYLHEGINVVMVLDLQHALDPKNHMPENWTPGTLNGPWDLPNKPHSSLMPEHFYRHVEKIITINDETDCFEILDTPTQRGKEKAPLRLVIDNTKPKFEP